MNEHKDVKVIYPIHMNPKVREVANEIFDDVPVREENIIGKPIFVIPYLGYVTTFMPYLETSYTEADIISLGTKAVVGGWASFKVQDIVMPDEKSRKAHSGSTWYWEVDYPLAAKTLQETIYGKSNITLYEDR